MTAEEQRKLVKRHYALSAAGDHEAAQECLTDEFTLAGHDGPPVEVAEVVWFRGNQICEIRPFYFDPEPFIAAAARNSAA